jgi:hypothetical protein
MHVRSASSSGSAAPRLAAPGRGLDEGSQDGNEESVGAARSAVTELAWSLVASSSVNRTSGLLIVPIRTAPSTDDSLTTLTVTKRKI